MQRIVIALVVALTLTGCANSSIDDGSGTNGSTDGTNDGTTGGCVDGDGDGFGGRTPTCPTGPDCDDTNAQVNPSATEACQDRVDNDCDGSIDEDCSASMGCQDADGDRYGVGDNCFGPDCDDDDAAINPSATEICGNGVDENCDPTDDMCSANCEDADGDGFGSMNGPDCGDAQMRVDCDDGDATINPDAVEVCDGDDNDCDGDTDECPLQGQACAGDTCQGGAGAECENHDDCAGQYLTCDASRDPKVCTATEGGRCADDTDCLSGLACQDGTCTGNFCALNTCDDPAYPHCDMMAGQCVQCRYYDGFPGADDDCDTGLTCTGGGWCAEELLLDTDDPYPNTDTTDEIFWTSIAMAYCWLDVRPDGDKAMCQVFHVSNAVGSAITENDVESAYVDGDMDAELFPDENDALHDIWGEGLFNVKDIDWKEDLQPGTEREICLWYQPGGFFGGETLVVDDCANFSP